MPATVATGKSGDNARVIVMPDGTGKSQAQVVTYPRGQYGTLTPITGITAANISGSGPWDLPTIVSGLPQINCLDAAYLWMGGDCSLGGGSINFIVAYYSWANRWMHTSATFSLSAQPNHQVSGQYLAQSGIQVDLLGAQKVAIIIPAAPTGTWNMYPELYI